MSFPSNVEGNELFHPTFSIIAAYFNNSNSDISRVMRKVCTVSLECLVSYFDPTMILYVFAQLKLTALFKVSVALRLFFQRCTPPRPRLNRTEQDLFALKLYYQRQHIVTFTAKQRAIVSVAAPLQLSLSFRSAPRVTRSTC